MENKDGVQIMKYTLEDIKNSPNKLAEHYSKFKVQERLLLTGHSHQAWPDVAEKGIIEAYNDAAELADLKWERAIKKAEEVQKGYARVIDDEAGLIALAPNTHDLIIRFLSALPITKKPKILSTDGEFHTIRRQLDRLVEEGIEVVKVSSENGKEVVGRLLEKLDSTYSAVMISKVFFKTGEIVSGLSELAKKCEEAGVELLVDSYHACNTIEFSIKNEGLQNAFIVGGGYKYMQLGEGNCFMRFPEKTNMRPVITGWFSEFSALAGKRKQGEVLYGEGSDRFAGSTYDPISHYRASEVLKFFEENELTPSFLREINIHQLSLLASEFDSYDLNNKIISRNRNLKVEDISGFMVFTTEKAGEIHKKLLENGVLTDYREYSLRFGPAPYLSDEQIKKSIEILAKVVKDF